MSFWLSQVNKVLNQLDERVENVAEEAPDVVATAASRARQILASQADSASYSDDENDDNDPFDREDDDQDEEYFSDEEYTDEELNSNNGPNKDDRTSDNDLDANSHIGTQSGQSVISDDGFSEINFNQAGSEKNESPISEKATIQAVSDERSQGNNEELNEGALSSVSSSPVMVEKPDESLEFHGTKDIEFPTAETARNRQEETADILTDIPRLQASETNVKKLEDTKLPQSNSQALISSGSAGLRQQQSVERSREQKEIISKLKVTLTETQSEVTRLQKQNSTLEQDLNAAQIEIQAQLKELENAALTVEQEREDFKSEREEMIEDHEEEIQNLKEEYEQKLLAQKEKYEQKLLDLQNNLNQEHEHRILEQDETTAELESALSREKDTLEKFIQLHAEKSELESAVTRMEQVNDALQKQVIALIETSQSAVKAQEDAEAKLDATVESYKRQLQQRQQRESELETTVAELGSALIVAQQEAVNATARASTQNISKNAEVNQSGLAIKEKYEAAVEELEQTKLQVSMLTTQCSALRKELQEVTTERVKEAATVQQQITDYNDKVQKLASDNQRLETTLRGFNRIDPLNLSSDSVSSPALSSGGNDARLRKLNDDLEQSKRKISTLSDQLMRQQGISEQLKSEVLALKGRLQAATARADAAERQQQLLLDEGVPSGDSIAELEAGHFARASRAGRRVKGGKNRFTQLPARSIRKAVGLRQTNYPGIQQQIARTIDALDVWMLETGGILRHEPLARLGFGVYLIIIHLWCFVLVTFHTIEAERHDLTQLQGPLHLAAHKH